jgi:signal transduction histidine kinase
MVAEDGEEALAQTARTVPDLVLLDVMMPGTDGFETCRQLKSQPTTKDVPVLFMTALHETSDKVKAFAVGGVDYITKPIEHEEALARIRTHLQLRRLQRELSDQLAMKDRFMRIASHDLRSPLCLIQMAAALAQRQATSPTALARQLDHIGDAAAMMRRVIDTFLDLRTANSATPIGRVDLNLVCAAVVRLHEPAAERKQISLGAELADPLPPVCGDASLCYQALTNLVSNAVKFSPPGRRVVVRTAQRGPVVRVSVQDEGPGVPASERNRLFQENARLSPRPTAGEESHGLGLAIVQHLIEAQDGKVGADFPTGGGSVFWFELPIERAASGATPPLKVEG